MEDGTFLWMKNSIPNPDYKETRIPLYVVDGCLYKYYKDGKMDGQLCSDGEPLKVGTEDFVWFLIDHQDEYIIVNMDEPRE